MYMFNVNWQYNRPIAALIVVPIVVLMEIKHVHSTVSYQWAAYQKYDPRGHALPSGYGSLHLT